MDGFNEKKWFVYLEDHHEGPFSVGEIQEKMQKGLVSGASYLWAEGMADWKTMSQIDAFSSLIHTTPKFTAISGSKSGSGESGAPVEKSASPVSNISLVLEEPSTGSIAASMEIESPANRTSAQKSATQYSAADPLAMSAATASAEMVQSQAEWALDNHKQESPVFDAPPAKLKKRSSASSGLIKASALLMGIGGLGYAGMKGYLDPLFNNPGVNQAMQSGVALIRPQLLSLQEYLPFVSDWVSPIPKLEDVTAADKEALMQASFASLSNEGPRVEVVPSNANPLAPNFYISSNLPEQTQLELQVEGVPSTLLNQLSFSAKTSGKVESGLAKTDVVRFADGKPIPKGEYWLYVFDSTVQPPEVQGTLQGLPAATTRPDYPKIIPPGRKILYRKKVFLGGTKDPQYLARLKEFHEKLAARATAEIGEVKQFYSTLSSQMSKSQQTFDQLKAGKLNKARAKMTIKRWDTFHQSWLKLDQQLNTIFAKWTPEVLKRDYYYSPLYVQIQGVGQSIAKLHSIQDRYFREKIDKKAFEAEYVQAQSEAQIALTALATKVTQAEQLGTTPNGMPKREGL